MEAKYINPFLESFINTLVQFGVTDVKRSNIKKKDSMYVDLDVSPVITLKGGIQGNIALSMSEDTAKKIASAMMMGMPVSAIDDMVKSALGELSSIIAGTACTLSSPLGVSFQVTQPSVLLGFSNISSLETLAINFDTQVGNIEFNIGLAL